MTKFILAGGLFLLLSFSVWGYTPSQEELDLQEEVSQLEQQQSDVESDLQAELDQQEKENQQRIETVQNRIQEKFDLSLSKQRDFYEKVCLEFNGKYNLEKMECSFGVEGVKGRKKKQKVFEKEISISEFGSVSVICDDIFFGENPRKGCTFSTGKWIDFKLSCRIPSLNELYEYTIEHKKMPESGICLWGENEVNVARRRMIKIAVISGVIVGAAAAVILTGGAALAVAPGGVGLLGGMGTVAGSAVGIGTAGAAAVGSGVATGIKLSEEETRELQIIEEKTE